MAMSPTKTHHSIFARSKLGHPSRFYTLVWYAFRHVHNEETP